MASMKASLIGTAVGSIAIVASAVFGCSVLLDFDADQCDIDADCPAATFKCVERVCVPSQPSSSGTGGTGGTGQGGCVTSEQCSADHNGLFWVCRHPNSGEDCVN